MIKCPHCDNKSKDEKELLAHLNKKHYKCPFCREVVDVDAVEQHGEICEMTRKIFGGAS